MRKKLIFPTLALLAFGTVGAHAQPAPADIIADNDKNGDKAIDRAEWAASPAPVPFPDDADTNKDGKIDQAELEALFAKAPPN